MGISKAYTTRVGAGPFPTELTDEVGKHLAERGHEFGSVTGRPRRCGWYDAVAMRRAVQLNSLTALCLTKLDVLDGLETLRIAVAYRRGNQEFSMPPLDTELFGECTPVYEEMPGWKESTLGLKKFSDLPQNARNYIKHIEDLAGIPIDIISTGPDREHTIIQKSVF